VLHLLHMLNEEVMLSVVLGLDRIAVYQLHAPYANNEITAEQVDRTGSEVRKIHAGLALPEVCWVGPAPSADQSRTILEAHEG
jgi:hypothetical protein